MVLTSGTDMTSAVTDLINGIIALFLMIRLLRQRPLTRPDRFWAVVFGLLMLTSLLGFGAHAFVLSQPAYDTVWRVMYAVMVCLMSGYAAAVSCELRNWQNTRGLLTLHAVIAIAGSALMVFLHGRVSYSFVFFVAFCALNIVLLLRRILAARKAGVNVNGWLFAVALLLLANIVQSIKSIQFTLIWPFNYNAVYHWMLLLFLLVQYRVIRRRGPLDTRDVK